MKLQLIDMYDLLNRSLTKSEVQFCVEKINKTGLIVKQTDCRAIPKEVYVRNTGFLKIVDDYKVESERFSKLSGDYMFTECFWGKCYIGEQKFRNIANKLALHLLGNTSLLASYLSEKYELVLTEKDLIISDINEYSKIKDNSLKKRLVGKFSKAKRNLVVVDGVSYINSNNFILELNSYDKIERTAEFLS